MLRRSNIAGTAKPIINPSLWCRTNDFSSGPEQSFSRGESDLLWNIDNFSRRPHVPNSHTSVSLNGIRGLGHEYVPNPALSSITSQPLPTLIEDPDIFHPSLPSELIPKPSTITDPKTGETVLAFNTAIGRSFVLKVDIDRFAKVAARLNLLGGGFDYHNNPGLLAARLSFFADRNEQLNWLVRLEELSKRIEKGIQNKINVDGLQDYSKSLSTSTAQLMQVPSDIPLTQAELKGRQRGDTAPYYNQGVSITPQIHSDHKDQYQASPQSREAQITQANVNTLSTSLNPMNLEPSAEEKSIIDEQMDDHLTRSMLMYPSRGRLSDREIDEKYSSAGVPVAPDVSSPMQLTPAKPTTQDVGGSPMSFTPVQRARQSIDNIRRTTNQTSNLLAELQTAQALRRQRMEMDTPPSSRRSVVETPPSLARVVEQMQEIRRGNLPRAAAPLADEIRADYERRQAAKRSRQGGEGIGRRHNKVAALRQLHRDIHAGEIRAGNNNQQLLASQFTSHPRFKHMPVGGRVR